jgi:CRISPR-associated protein Csm1
MGDARKYEVIMGALLHDIGKFFQRAVDSEEVLSAETRGLESTICPVFKGTYSHRHVLFSSEFCSEYLGNIPKGLEAGSINALASYHHRPADAAQEIIQEADRLSSGMERVPDEAEIGRAHGKFRKVRLIPVTAEVASGTGKDVKWERPLLPLRPERLFPEECAKDASTDRTTEYSRLWSEFLEVWRTNEVPDWWGYVNRCLGILEEFTWCIPSATWGVIPDISLYDHLKTTAAIAGCIQAASSPKDPFVLVVGDFGGIQSYIFDIHAGAGGLAKRLRARSFFVDMANCSVAFEILRRMDLPLTNCLMLSGGKFILLLPNNEETWSHLDQIRESLDLWSVRETTGEVRLNMAALSCSRKDLLNYPRALGRLHDKLAYEKLTAFRSYLCSSDSGWNQDAFMMAPLLDSTKGEELCRVCQKRGGLPTEDGEPVCAHCLSDAKMGARLPRTRMVAFYEDHDTSGWRLPFGSMFFLTDPQTVRGNPFLVLSLGACRETFRVSGVGSTV